MPSCLRLLVHCILRAASRAAWTAGNNRAISTPTMEITTSSSISVKPRRASGVAGLRAGFSAKVSPPGVVEKRGWFAGRRRPSARRAFDVDPEQVPLAVRRELPAAVEQPPVVDDEALAGLEAEREDRPSPDVGLESIEQARELRVGGASDAPGHV